MEFIEPPHFTRQVTALMPDELYRLVQNEFAQNPEAGDLIPGGGGIRKIRAALPGAGLDPQQTSAFKILVKEIERYG